MLKEKIDAAKILDGAKTNQEIAEKLKSYGVLCPPCKVGEDVYFLVARGSFGSLLVSGVPIKRRVDEIGWNGKDFIIHSYRDMPNDPCGNLSSEWENLVFETEEQANQKLKEIKEKNLR